MKDYVIINGVSSKTKTGLAINILPPITKPKMRTLTEEIDGRDGDIITKLGYSAYDKTIEIGLFGNGYDVDDIIAFFNKEGTITFSNEPTKYYNFTLVDSFDIERLLQFKTATITFHCQPFKYEVGETPKEIEYQYVNGEGTEITLNGTANTPMQLELNPSELTQETTPTPDNPQQVQVIKGNNSIKIESKNLLNPNNLVVASPFVSMSNENILTIETNSTGYFKTAFDDLNLPSGTYTFYCEILSGDYTGGNLCFFDLNDTQVTGEFAFKLTTTYPNHVYTKTFTNGLNQLKFYRPYCTSQTKLKLWIVKGEYATMPNFVAHQEQVLPLNLPSGMEYCKIGTYEDEFEHDLSTDKWYINKNTGKKTFTGSDNWIASPVQITGSLKVYCTYNFPNTTESLIQGWFMTNLLTKMVYTDYSNATKTGIAPQLAGVNVAIKDTTMTLSDWKTFLNTNNLHCYYRLSTPTHTEITDTTLINQLNAIEQAVSYDEQTNISQTNADLPFIIKATAMISGSESVEIINNGNIYAKPVLDIKGTGTINIYLNGTQMLSVNITDEIVIDVPNLEAYNPNTTALMNRNVTGDISKFILPVGTNTISVDGDVELVTISLYKRWL